MNNDWLVTSINSGILIMVVGFIFCFGSEINEKEWQKDCTQMGTHRVKDIVYKCEVIK
jgi:hypothetical protein